MFLFKVISHSAFFFFINYRNENFFFSSFNLFAGWNSLERLDTHGNIKYLNNGFSHFLNNVFLDRISPNKIQCNSLVKRISLSDDDEQSIEIEIFRDNQMTIIYHAQHVVCTQSLGCLKRTMHEMFRPSLPFEKQLAIERLGFGTINKVSNEEI